MASIKPYQTAKGQRYRVQYTDPDGGRRQKRGFLTKKQAETWAEDNAVDARRGLWINPNDGKATVGELGQIWLDSRTHLKPSSWAALDASWRTHVKPAFGTTAVADIKTSDVQAWLSNMVKAGKSPTIVRRAVGVLASVLDVAVDDKRILANPARGKLSLPAKKRSDKPVLTIEQVQALADAATAHSELIWVLATTGLRWGEAVALRVADVDTKGKRLHVRENAPTVRGKVEIGSPKTHQQRSVAVPEFVLEKLKPVMKGKKNTDWLWANKAGTPLTTPSTRSWFYSAVRACQAADAGFPDITPHSLRHTAVSLLISAGASVKVVQRQVGHAGAKMTLDVYATLFPDELDSVATTMDTLMTKKKDEGKGDRPHLQIV